jgi:hypothetical protein
MEKKYGCYDAAGKYLKFNVLALDPVDALAQAQDADPEAAQVKEIPDTDHRLIGEP